MALSREQKQWVLYGSLAVGGFLAIRFGIPWITKQFGKTASDTAKAASTAVGVTAGSVITAAPRAIGAAFQEVKDFSLSDDNPFKSFGESVGGWLYDLTHSSTAKPATLKGLTNVNGQEYAVYSDGQIYRVQK